MPINDEIRQSIKVVFSHVSQRAGLDSTLNVGFGADAAYIRPMGVALISLAENNPKLHLAFHLIISSIHEEDFVRLREIGNHYEHISICVYQVDEHIIGHLPTIKHFPLAMYFRLMLPLILEDVDSILYLDSDIICLNSISVLQKTPLGNYVCAAAPDVRSTREEKVAELKLASGQYFNSGVLLINIPEWNRQNISEKVMNVLASGKHRFSLPDQDALNLVLENQVFFLEKELNCLPARWGHLMKTGQEEKIVFLHCTIYPKPWKAACSNPLQPYYLKYERLSPWKEVPPEMPSIYREARLYANRQLGQGMIADAFLWYGKYLFMKLRTKYSRLMKKIQG